MDRRFFIKQVAWFFLVLANCGRQNGPAAHARSGAGACGISISRPPRAADPSGDPNRLRILYRDRLPPDRRPGVHPLGGVLVTAIAAGRQLPYCANIGRGMDVTRVVPEKQGDIYRYEFEVDVAEAIGFSGKGLTFYVHVSCRQHRSQVIVMHLEA
jgi:hypothetical protein